MTELLLPGVGVDELVWNDLESIHGNGHDCVCVRARDRELLTIIRVRFPRKNEDLKNAKTVLGEHETSSTNMYSVFTGYISRKNMFYIDVYIESMLKWLNV